jgi:ribosome-binding protein aMBF1 (putative translation factor)
LIFYVEFPILVWEVIRMPKSYEEISAARRARLDPSAAAAREVFEKAYDIAMQIVALREKAGITQVELAERTGISQADISRIERGATSPTAKTLQRIAEALDAEVRLVAKTA